MTVDFTGDGPLATSDLGRALGNAGLTVRRAAVVPAAARTAGATLTVTPSASDQRALLLVQDRAGTVSWHLPAPSDSDDGQVTFDLPARYLPASADTPDEADRARPARPRSTDGASPALLSVLEFPVGAVVGRTAAEVYDDWERAGRRPVVRWFPPKDRLQDGVVLTDASWRTLAAGRTLLFLHGIFSRSASAFSGLWDPDRADGGPEWAALAGAYDGRVIAYDHPTASVTPEDNVAAFLATIPQGVHLDLDIVAHSRGGLVARILDGQLAEPVEPGGEHGSVTVHKIVYAGTPNGGTAIVERRNWITLANWLTTLVLVRPPGPWSVTTTVLEGVIELVKAAAEEADLVTAAAEGAEQSMPGLRAMEPDSSLFARLGQAGHARQYAIDTNYEPGTGWLALLDVDDDLLRSVDTLADTVFGGADNDIAVPTLGVGDPARVLRSGRIPGFPVPRNRRLSFGTSEVWHCSYFREPQTRRALTRWLQPDEDGETP